MINEGSNPVVADTVDNVDDNVFNNQVSNKIINKDGKLIDTTNYRSPIMKYTDTSQSDDQLDAFND